VYGKLNQDRFCLLAQSTDPKRLLAEKCYLGPFECELRGGR